MKDNDLPTFEDVRSKAHRMLGDVEDELRSDFRGGHGPNDKQIDALWEARRSIAAAKSALDLAAREGTRARRPPPTEEERDDQRLRDLEEMDDDV